MLSSGVANVAGVAGSAPDDVWIPSACGICYSHCAIKVHRVNGVVVKIEGNPDSPLNQGRICARGLSGIMQLYHPKRLNVPLKRTNPEKGIGIDPGWVEISWDEALDTIAEKLKKIRADDPRKLLCACSVSVEDPSFANLAFGTAFGTPNYWFSGAGTHCGNAEHLFAGVLHGSWVRQPDPNYCRYLLNFGVPVGTGAYYAVNAMAQRLADARVNRGLRHVVVDPWSGMAAEKADEWVPIRPGTDGAMALAMLNVILNELGICDVEHLKHHTNAPYLIGPDGHYVRDNASNKPLVWDAVDQRAKCFDDETVRDFALTGEYRVDGVIARPAFALLKEHVKRFTPEWASEVTTVPAATMRRLAREFAEAAQVGSTIVIDGKSLPYRPVAVLYFKGVQGHRHASLSAMAFELLPEVLGASHVPGSALGPASRSLGFPETGRPAYDPGTDPDGLLTPGTWVTPQAPLPLRPAQKPETVHLQDLVPTSCVCSPYLPLTMADPGKYGIPYKIEMQMQTGSNFLMTLANPNTVAPAFRDVFTVNFNIFLDETTDLADIVLPDANYLERHDMRVEWMGSFLPVDYWHATVAQPAVPPAFRRRPTQEVLLDLAERVGMLGDFYAILNLTWGLRGEYVLDPGRKYAWKEIIDRRNKSLFGPEHGLEWFKKNGVLKWPKTVEETYWTSFLKVRVPIYFEFIQKAGEDMDRVQAETGLKIFDSSDFQPLPDWRPCRSHEEKRSDYDLYLIYYRVPFHTFSSTYQNPWLDEVSRIDPYTHYVTMNASTARSKGLSDGDWIEIESASTGGTVRGKVRTSQGVHPEVVAIHSGGGHWARGLGAASQSGKGVCVEWLMPLSIEDSDVVSFTQDLCMKVSLRKIQAPADTVDRPWLRAPRPVQ